MHFILVIPAYQESQRLPTYLRQLLPLCEACPEQITIQIVDDGSGDEEVAELLKLIEPFRKEFNSLAAPILLPENRGKGGAVYEGWSRSPACDFLGFLDADGSIPASEVIRLVRLAANHPDQSFCGSRIKMLGRSITRSPKRHYVGRLYATLLSLVLDLPVYDSQCGYKLLPYDAYLSIRDRLQEPGFAFDAEILVLLNGTGIDIVEVPIDWHDNPGSKVHLVRDGIRMALALHRIKRRHCARQ